MRIIKELQDERELLDKIDDGTTEKNIFLGNGFNLSLEINTSYKAIYESLNSQEHTQEFIRNVREHNEEFDSSLESSCYNLENLINKFPEISKQTIRTEIYRTLLNRCRKRIKNHKKLINMLFNFNQFFTTNYDPLLYRFLLNFVRQEDVNEKLLADMKKLNDYQLNYTDSSGQSTSLYFSKIERRTIYLIAKRIFEVLGIHSERTQEDYFNALKIIRGDKYIEINDGFRSLRNNDKHVRWDSTNNNQNIFYIHGALNFHQEDDVILKYVLKKGSHDKTFINEILKNFTGNKFFCVFEKDSQSKKNKIQNNRYLKYCFDALSKLRNDIFIIGWSCSENDRHLIEAINNNNSEMLYISCQSDETRDRFKNVFRGKNLTFFKPELLPYVDKKKNE